jgi:hypothetical protein
VEIAQSPKRQRFLGRRVPPSLFGIALGLAGLAEAWHAAGPLLGTTQAIPSALNIGDAALLLVLVGAYPYPRSRGRRTSPWRARR